MATLTSNDVSSNTSREEMGALLRVGVITAAVVVIVGGAFYIAKAPAGTHASFGKFAGEAGALRSITGIVRAAFHGDSRAIIQSGILLLIATPVARVIFGALSFLRARDWIYVALSATVLCVLLFSLFFD